MKWCNARSEKNGIVPAYYTDTAKSTIYRTGESDPTNDMVKWDGPGYRLPTEAEWEYAARGGSMSQGYTYSGSNAAGSVAWYEPNSTYSTHPVGTKAANEIGIHDMSGNVLEYVWDWYGKSFPAGGRWIQRDRRRLPKRTACCAEVRSTVPPTYARRYRDSYITGRITACPPAECAQ